MFILEHSDSNTLTTDNECKAFATRAKAYAAMANHLIKCAHEDDYTISRRVECAPGFSDLYGNWLGEGGGKLYLGFLNDWDAYLADGEHRWVIHEVPGVYIPESAADGFKQSIKEMREMYADEERGDWADADDTARDIAYELEEYLG